MFGRAVIALAVLCIVGCSSSGSGSPTSTAPPGSGATSLPVGSPAAGALAKKIKAGLAGLTSAHIVVDAGSLGGKSSGDISYADGVATASDITLESDDGDTQIVTVGDKSYAKVPPGRNTTGKPWVVVSADSSNEFVRALAGTLDLSKAAASLPAIADLAGTASSVTDKGETAKGHRYALVIDPSKSSGTTLGTLLSNIGQSTVPVDVYLDGKDRLTHVRVGVKLGTQTLDFTVDASKFDAPVSIKAPAAGDIAG